MSAKKTTKPQTQTGTAAIRAHFLSARRGIEEAAAIDDPDPNLPRGDIKPGQWEGAPFDAMPPDCPVHVIGRDVEGTIYCLTATNDMRQVAKWDHVSLVDLFAPYPNYAYWAWPGFTKPKVDSSGAVIEPPRVARLERDKAATCLINQAAKRPLFDPATHHRGRGGWADRHGNMLWHSGSALWRVDSRGELQKASPGEHDGFLYTRQPVTIEPWETPVETEQSPALRILEDLKTWKWERPYLDPVLCLGWIATALMGGALKTRPVIFTTGGPGVGKTTMRELIRNVLEGAVFSVADTTAAGIYQRLKNDALMVMVDELENKPGSTRAQAVIDLARIAYSGDDMARGGQDHHGVSFKMFASFFFSAINPPPMTEADKSRMAILNLERLDQVNGLGRKVDVSIDTDGRMILRQVMDGWRHFNETILQDWWETLAKAGLDSRAIDTYGTLLAAAELLVGEEALQATGLPVNDQEELGRIIGAATSLERAERLENWHKCLNHLLDSTIEAWREGMQPTIGSVLESIDNGREYPQGLDTDEARKRLQLANLGIRKAGDPGAGPCLAIPTDGPKLRRIFDDTPFRQGQWFQALKQAPKNVVLRDEGSKQKVSIGGTTKHCLLVDMAAFKAYVEKEG